MGSASHHPLDFAGEVRLLSYEAPQKPVAADDLIPLTLYFQAQTEIGVPYNIGVQVVDDNGLNWMADSSRPFNWRFIADEPLAARCLPPGTLPHHPARRHHHPALTISTSGWSAPIPGKRWRLMRWATCCGAACHRRKVLRRWHGRFAGH
ncbi:MAG: hypothetical protein M5U34_42970 [Chloroflexi bacterium]|nr:hypothetical protein [Chloroflexota bacterium]